MEIFYPVAALAALTFAVLFLTAFVRFRAAFAGRVKGRDFRYGESRDVPGDVSIPNRNLMNLLETPLLFYVVCVALFATRTVDAAALMLAWIYVALRFAHTAVHLTYNNVFHRLLVFAAGNLVLIAIWVRFIWQLR